MILFEDSVFSYGKIIFNFRLKYFFDSYSQIVKLLSKSEKYDVKLHETSFDNFNKSIWGWFHLISNLPSLSLHHTKISSF